MKKILVLTMALAFLGLGLTIASADPVTNYSQTIVTVTEYNPFGIAIRSTATTTTKTVTQNLNTNETYTNIEISVASSTWHGGSLKVNTVNSSGNGTGSDGSTSKSDILDNYYYDNYGRLTSVSGSGTSTSTNGENGQVSTGAIARTFLVKDGQALFAKSITEGTVKDKNGSQIGTFGDTTTIAEGDYEYLGGSWVPSKQTNVSNSTINNETTVITRVTTYGRDATTGAITGLEQTATGSMTTHQNGGTQEWTLTYSAEVAFDEFMGWYVKKETTTWTVSHTDQAGGGQQSGRLVKGMLENRGQDPVVYGEVIGTVVIDGVAYLQVAAEYVDILDGQGLQEAEGEVFLIQCTEAELALLAGMIGQNVMLMGDIAGAAAAGALAVFDINPEYGGGIEVGVPQQDVSAEALENLYQGESWYGGNLSVMAEIWHGIQLDWVAGVQQLVNLAGR